MDVLRQIDQQLGDPFWRELWSTPASSLPAKLDQTCQEKIKCQHELLAKVASQSTE